VTDIESVPKTGLYQRVARLWSGLAPDLRTQRERLVRGYTLAGC